MHQQPRTLTRRAAVTGMAGAFFAAVWSGGATVSLADAGTTESPEPPWWKSAVAYEIYPRSFQDTNGDGIGDFRGMTERLAYLADLGIDAIWVAACFDSPNADNGYDVRDYRKIMPDFGSMADFDDFMAQAQRRGIRVILDMVFNHTSNQHQWFAESRKSRDNPYRDYYFWRDGAAGKPPTNWPSVFGGSAWELDPRTNQYYLHTFAKEQPDLNWENPAVRRELYAILAFWAAKGVSGFRFDAIMHISKPAVFRDLTPAELQNPGPTGGPKLDAYLREMHAAVFAGTALYSVAEGWGATRETIIDITDDRHREMSSAFRMDFALLDLADWKKLPWRLDALRAFNADNAFNENAHVWPLVFLEDHDFPRSVSRFGSTNPAFHDRSAKLLATLLLSLKGTPFLYQGQEIGMSNYPFTHIEQFDDIAVKNGWRDLVLSGKIGADEYLRNVAQTGRDNARTPMQWDATANAGFTTSAQPWLAVNPNSTHVNVAAQVRDPQSVLQYYRRMIALRKRNQNLAGGTYRDRSAGHPTVYAYTLGSDSEALCVLLNFADEPSTFTLPAGLSLGQVLIGNLPAAPQRADGAVELQPWQSVIFSSRG